MSIVRAICQPISRLVAVGAGGNVPDSGGGGGGDFLQAENGDTLQSENGNNLEPDV